MNIKMLKKAIFYDIRNGIIKKKIFIIIPVIIFFINCIQYGTIIQGLDKSGSDITLMDYIIFTFKGNKEYIKEEGFYKLPMTYLAIVLFIGFIVSNYPVHELKEYGTRYMLDFQKKIYWWIGKCVWSILNVVCFYLTGFITIFFYTVITGGKISFSLGNDILYYGEFLKLDESGFKLILNTFILSIIVMVALMQIVITLQFILNPIIAYILLVIYFISSAFFKSEYLLGNGLMLKRNIITSGSGVVFFNCVIYSILIWLVFFVLGYKIFNKKDIL